MIRAGGNGGCLQRPPTSSPAPDAGPRRAASLLCLDNPAVSVAPAPKCRRGGDRSAGVEHSARMETQPVAEPRRGALLIATSFLALFAIVGLCLYGLPYYY